MLVHKRITIKTVNCHLSCHLCYSKNAVSAKDFCWTDLFEKCELFWQDTLTGKIITGCLEFEGVPGKFWCPTRITNGAYHPGEKANVGFCSKNCPIHSEERLDFLRHQEIKEVPLRLGCSLSYTFKTK